MGRKLKSFLGRVWSKKWIRHILYWIFTYIFLFSTIWFLDSIALAWEITTAMILPLPLPVYVHFILLKTLFEKRKYVAYAIGSVLLIVLSGFVVVFVFRLFEPDPNSHTSGIGVAFFAIVITTGLHYFSQGAKQRVELQEAKFNQMKTELALLKAQINPHFFFNTLNNLYSLSLDRSKEVPQVILKISELMRYVLESSKLPEVPLSQEIQFLESFVDLQRLRLDKRHRINWELTGDPGKKSIAPMLLVPFVENCFKHGMNSANGGFLNGSIEIGKSLKLHLENSKSSSQTRLKEPGSRVGLANVQRRLELLYPEKHRLNIQDGDTYVVDLEIVL